MSPMPDDREQPARTATDRVRAPRRRARSGARSHARLDARRARGGGRRDRRAPRPPRPTYERPAHARRHGTDAATARRDPRRNCSPSLPYCAPVIPLTSRPRIFPITWRRSRDPRPRAPPSLGRDGSTASWFGTLRIGGYQVGLLPMTWQPTPHSKRTEGLALTLRAPATTGPASKIGQPTANGIDTRLRYLFTLPAPAAIKTQGMTLERPPPRQDQGDGRRRHHRGARCRARRRHLGPAVVVCACRPDVEARPVRGNRGRARQRRAGAGHRRHPPTSACNRCQPAPPPALRPSNPHNCRLGFGTYSLPATAQMVWTNASGTTVNTVAAPIHLFPSTEHPDFPFKVCPSPKAPAQ